MSEQKHCEQGRGPIIENLGKLHIEIKVNKNNEIREKTTTWTGKTSWQVFLRGQGLFGEGRMLAEAHSKPCKISKMQRFAKLISGI